MGVLTQMQTGRMQNCSYKRDVSHIVYAADDAFAEILGISLLSLFHNNRELRRICIYILDSGISEQNREKIEQVCKMYNRELPEWIAAKNISKELSMEVAMDRGSLSQYARLFVSSALPGDLKRVLYLDCDVIVNQSIDGLWNLNLKGKTVGALMDAFSRQYRKNIGLRPNDIMFNSGVMLIDLERWREQDVESRLLDFIVRKKGKIQQGDQGALNAVLYQDVYCFEPWFNSVTIFYDFSYEEMLVYRKPPEFYSRQQIKKAVTEPVIIHFTSSFLSKRPWVMGCQHPYVGEWMKYKKRSPWEKSPLHRHGSVKGIKGAYAFFVKAMPRRLAISISGMLQAYARPAFFKVMYR